MFYLFIYIVKNIKFGYNKQILQKYTKLKLILKFLIRDESKKIKREAYSKVIELTIPLMYFNDDIEINELNLTDSLIIKYNKLNEFEKEDNHIVIKIKKLKKDIDEDAVWTIGNYSFINLVYNLTSTFEKFKLFNSNRLINSVTLGNKTNLKYNSIIGELNGEFGGEATCSTGSTGKRENNNQFHSDKANNKNPNFDDNPMIIIKEDKVSLNKQKAFIKDDDKSKNVQKSRNNKILNNSMNNNYEILEDNFIINDENNIFSKEYISKLDYSEFQYDTFCQCVLITGLKFDKINFIEKSEEFPASCGHKECSILQSITPSILYSYQNQNKKIQIDINDLTPYLVFPLGIKICMAYDLLSEYPKQNKPFMNRIENKVGESFYIISLLYYKQMTFKKFQERYKINPLLSYSNKNKNKKFEKEIEIISKLALSGTIFVPECISLISRFPYFYQIEECLKSLITISDNKKINSFINHLINQIPVPYKNQEIKFYIPNNSEPIQILNPFNFNISNFQFLNILNYFSNQSIIIIFYLILMEQQILFIDNDFSLLSLVSFLFIKLIYPFSWSNTYIPVLSFSSVKFLESIIPYIMGADETLFSYALENQYIGNKVIFINISKNNIYISNNKRINLKNANKLLDLPKFPEKFENMLNKKLDTIRKLNNNLLIIENLEYIFCKLMVIILNDYLDHCFIIDEDIIFNSESFLDRKIPEEKSFYKELIQTQLFSQFLLSRKEQFIKNKKIIEYDNVKKGNKSNIELFFQDTKIIHNKYGYIYDNLYIDYSLFHDYEKDYFSKYKKINLDNLNLKYENKLRRADIQFNKSSKTHGRYSLFLIKNKKNYIEKKSTNEFKKKADKILQTNTLSNMSTTNLSSSVRKNNSLKVENDSFDMDYLNEESKNRINFTKQKKLENESKYLLFPFFLEKHEENIIFKSKDLYIKNKVDEIIKADFEINKIIKTKNIPDYILPSYKRYEFYLINEDYKRYFPNSLQLQKDSIESGKVLSLEFSSEDEDINNEEEMKNKKINNKNFLKINYNNNKEISFINEWFNIICSSDKKKFKNIETNNLIKLLLKKNENLSYFSDLIFQDYIPLFKHIKSNNSKILTHECLNELYKVLLKILPTLKSDDKYICKKLTLSFFIYGYYNQRIKNNRFIISKINEIFNSSSMSTDKVCPLWGEISFWNFWLLNDLETYKNNNYFIDNESNSFEGNDENNLNTENNEYEYLLEICKILNLLGKNNKFIKKCIIDSIAPNYLVPNEIDDLENEVFTKK